MRFLLAVAVLVLTVGIQAKPLDKVIAFYQDKPSIAADFEQTVTVKSPHRVLKRRGRVYFKRPGRMRWDYKWPDEVYYVSDGRTFWAYDVDEEVVYRSSVKRSSLFFALKILFDFNGIYDEFECGDQGRDKAGNNTVWLKPKRELPMQKVKLVFKPNGEIVSTSVLDNLGNLSTVEFKNQKFEPVPDKAFEFKIPKGAPVQDLDAQGADVKK